MAAWKLHEAKARLTELIKTAEKQGPQIITQRGVEKAAVVPIAEWKRLQSTARPTLKELLLAPEPRFELVIPKRRKFRLRQPVTFE